MALCGFCNRRFRNKQAWVAHSKRCEPYQEYKRNKLPKADLPITAAPRKATRAYFTGTQRTRFLILGIADKLRVLTQDAEDYAAYARMLERMLPRHGHAGYEEWAELYRDLAQASRDASLLVNGYGEHSLPLDLYHRVIVTHETWIAYRTGAMVDAPESMDHEIVSGPVQQVRPELQAEETLFQELIFELKQVVSMCPR